MFSHADLEVWRIRNEISLTTINYINTNIRFAPPARSVGQGNRSITGKYPSKKMGHFIQWESRTVEGPAVYMMENDKNVMEYYDQPNKINIKYIDTKGKKRAFLYTPDFFVILSDQAGWEEWKTEEELKALSEKQPWRYTKGEDGKWRCPPCENFAKEYGLFFKVRTDKEINWVLVRNFNFLDSYLRKIDELDITTSDMDQIKRAIFQVPGINFKQLLDKNSNVTADQVYIAIIKGLIYTDLDINLLVEPENVLLFLNEEHSEMYKNFISCQIEVPRVSVITLEPNERILWDEVVWKIVNVGNESISLLSTENEFIELPRYIVENLIAQGKMLSQKELFSEANNLGNEIIIGASEEDYKLANYRLKYVTSYFNGVYENEDGPSPRTVRDWIKNYKDAESVYGNGYLGLLPKNKNKGNRTQRLNEQVINIMEEVIQGEYETKVQKNKSVVYGELKNRCEDLGLDCPSYVTFSNYINNKPREQITRARKGERAAYQQKTFYWELHNKTPRHGDFPFNVCHLDHTELDIELVCSNTGKNLGRPYLSLMTDAYSRRIISFYLTYEPPSYRSCMMTLRDCVKRHSRLPQSIVVDNGKEFHSVYFETLLAMYECEPRRRPAAQPRYGSILERLFGTTNTMFIHNLQGNTKIMKDVRQVTKSFNPKNNAVWTLSVLQKALENFFFDLYDNIEHPSLGHTPRNVYQESLLTSGQRKHSIIRYDSFFEIMTLPSTKTGVAKLQPSHGVKINYIFYWNDEFKNPELENTKLKVRYDPYNMGIAYAFVKNRWIKCISQYYTLFNSLTEKEFKFITSELKKNKQNHAKNFTLTAQKVAKFIKECEDNEVFNTLKKKAVENKKATMRVLENAPDTPNNVSKIKKEKVVNEPLGDLALELYEEF